MEKKTNKYDWESIKWIFIFFVGIIAWIRYQAQSKRKEPYVTTRKALAKLYCVDLKTFNKWVQLFSDPSVLSYVSFAKQRGLTQKQNEYLINLFGSPTDGKPNYSKFDIASSDDEMGHNDYRGVRESINQWSEKYNINAQIYAQLNIFPPRLGAELKHQLG